MEDLLYEDMSPSQAAEALEEFLAERDPALARLRAAVAHGGLDPGVVLVDPHPPAQTRALVDGFTSHLAQIVTAAVPAARWRVGEHRIADHPLLDYPLLIADSHQS